MHRNTKIATCCFCGARTALVLDGARHELVCGQCGAPLHSLKRLKTDGSADSYDRNSSARRPVGPVPPEISGEAFAERQAAKSSKPPKGKDAYRARRKKKKPLFRKVLGEVVDLIEDVFD